MGGKRGSQRTASRFLCRQSRAPTLATTTAQKTCASYASGAIQNNPTTAICAACRSTRPSWNTWRPDVSRDTYAYPSIGKGQRQHLPPPMRRIPLAPNHAAPRASDEASGTIACNPRHRKRPREDRLSYPHPHAPQSQRIHPQATHSRSSVESNSHLQ